MRGLPTRPDTAPYGLPCVRHISPGSPDLPWMSAAKTTVHAYPCRVSICPSGELFGNTDEIPGESGCRPSPERSIGQSSHLCARRETGHDHPRTLAYQTASGTRLQSIGGTWPRDCQTMADSGSKGHHNQEKGHPTPNRANESGRAPAKCTRNIPVRCIPIQREPRSDPGRRGNHRRHRHRNSKAHQAGGCPAGRYMVLLPCRFVICLTGKLLNRRCSRVNSFQFSGQHSKRNLFLLRE